MDRGADFIILDVRPGSDYMIDHITGAISLPFFEVEQRLSELPKDKWIVAYCACPRKLSEQTAKVLRANGYKKVKVLYEGYPGWRRRGYPVTSA